MKSSKLIKKGDVFVMAVIFAVSLVWFMITFLSFGESRQVKIYLEGDIYKTVDLSVLEDEEIISLDGCEIKVTKDGACFLFSDCPDGLCVKRGMLKKGGDVMACVPKGITVEITSAESVDGISY